LVLQVPKELKHLKGMYQIVLSSDKSYNYNPYEVPKELQHLKGMYQIVLSSDKSYNYNLYEVPKELKHLKGMGCNCNFCHRWNQSNDHAESIYKIST
jgi:hypothetical protein